MIADGLGSVTFVNGILRVQLTNINAEGKIVESGSIEIPGAKVGDVINGLVNASQGIVEKLNETNDNIAEDGNKSSGKSKSKDKKK
jgi:hypothetical protein